MVATCSVHANCPIAPSGFRDLATWVNETSAQRLHHVAGVGRLLASYRCHRDPDRAG
jgi:hypothetical protein